MNFQHFRKQLNELNDFFNYIENRFQNQQLSDIDRDTLVDFVRDLYKSAIVQNKNTNAELPFEKNNKEGLDGSESINTKAILENPQPDIINPIEPPLTIKFRPEASEVEESKPVEEEVPVITTINPVQEAPKVEAIKLVEEPVISTTSFVLEMPEVEDAKPIVAPETTSFVFEVPQKQTQSEPIVVQNTAFEIVDIQEETPIVVEENNLVVIAQEPPQSEETGVTLRNKTEMSTQVNNSQPQIILNTIIDDEMFEERKAHFNPEYDDLFYIKTSNDLSAKLAEKRIDDLNKAMGFNDKFLYINELFGGNAIKFKTAIDHFNNEAKSINDARVFIERELIENFNWNSALKSNLAKDFIKLLRRRYLKI